MLHIKRKHPDEYDGIKKQRTTAAAGDGLSASQNFVEVARPICCDKCKEEGKDTNQNGASNTMQSVSHKRRLWFDQGAEMLRALTPRNGEQVMRLDKVDSNRELTV